MTKNAKTSRKILVDGFYLGRGRGVGNYLTNVLRAADALTIEGMHVIVVVPETHRTTELRNPNIRTIKVPAVPFPIWENVVMPIANVLLRPDVTHFPANSSSMTPLFGKRIVTIHDMMFHKKAQLIPTSPVFRQRIGRKYLECNVTTLARRYAQIITVSQSSKDDIAQYLPVAPENIQVHYEGPGLEFDEPRLALEQRTGLLHFASRDPRKNTMLVIQAYAKSIAPARGFVLHLVGHGFTADDIPPEARDSVRIHGFASQEELQQIVNQTRVLLYPSRYEGFGMPIVECQRIGIPVITSNGSACAEVGASGTLLVNPSSTNELIHAINTLCTEASILSNLAIQSKMNAGRFNWERCAQQLLDTYEKV